MHAPDDDVRQIVQLRGVRGGSMHAPDDDVRQIVQLRGVVQQIPSRLVHHRGELTAPGAVRPV